MPPEDVQRLVERTATRAAEKALEGLTPPPCPPAAVPSWIDTPLGKVAIGIVTAGFLAASTGTLLMWRDVAIAATERAGMSKQIDRIEEDVAKLAGRQYDRDHGPGGK